MTEQESSGTDESGESPSDEAAVDDVAETEADDGPVDGSQEGESAVDETDGSDGERDGQGEERSDDGSDDDGGDAGGGGAAASDLADGLIERVESAEPEELAGELSSLRLRVNELEGELAEREEQIEDLESRLARKQADFQNYKQRQQRKLEEERERATEALVERLLDVRDNLARALDQDEDADIRGGVESTLRQFDEELARENVERIEPGVGEETDPQRHEVLMRVESDQPEGTVADLHRPGYEMAGKVLQPAQVTVSDGGDADESGESGQGDE